MKLFEMKDYNLHVSEEAWGLLPFKAILKRDKSRNKEMAFKEMLFIYFYTDVRSDYVHYTDGEKLKEIIKDIGLPTDWKLDSIMQDAINFYEERSVSVIAKLYKSALKSANDTSEYLEMTADLLRERTDKGGTVTTLPMITASQKTLPEIMKNLKAAYKEVIAEQKELEGRTKGSRTMGLFEDGFTGI
jgi:hypothetical protein